MRSCCGKDGASLKNLILWRMSTRRKKDKNASVAAALVNVCRPPVQYTIEDAVKSVG
jgi:hypothetical protein